MTDPILTALLAAQEALMVAFRLLPITDVATRAVYRGIAVDLGRELARRAEAVAGEQAVCS
jgi:hypothetical protein